MNYGHEYEAGVELLRSLGNPSEMPQNFAYDYAAAAALAVPEHANAKDLAISTLNDLSQNGFFAATQDDEFVGPGKREEFASIRSSPEFRRLLELVDIKAPNTGDVAGAK